MVARFGPASCPGVGAVEPRIASRFTVLGPVRAWQGSNELQLGTPQQRAVLAALLVREGSQASLGELIDVVWGWNESPSSAEQVVRTYIHRLRRALDPDRPAAASLIASVGDGYALRVEGRGLDLIEFRQLTSEAEAARDFRDISGARRLLREALGLWNGVALAGIPGEYAETQRAFLGKLRLAALESLMAAQLELGAYGEAAAELSSLVAEHPFDERFRELYMIALYRSGRQAEALATYQDAHRLLTEELGIEPGPELREVHARILRGELLDEPAQVRDDASWPVPTRLPPDPRGFSAREAELADAIGKLDRDRGRAAVTVISGMAGVGKTTFGIHLGHRLADRFPDGQLYVDLRGFGPANEQVPAETALYVLLEALGVPPESIPKDAAGRAAMFRSLLADRRMLLVLDNARDAEQVRPLLPGVPTSLVLITSRDQLTGLLVTDDADLITLDVLSPEQAHRFLVSKLGARRVAAEPEAVGEILQRCARLPLAISLVAARAAANPEFDLTVIAAELRAQQGLHAFENLEGPDVRSVFSWSYRTLTPDGARLFRLLSLAPSPRFDLTRVASLAGVPLNEARRLVAELTRANLLTEYLVGKFLLHDLIRAYAAEQAEAADRTERHEAFVRLLNHLLHTAFAAAMAVTPQRHPIEPVPVTPGVSVDPIEDRSTAAAWLTGEHTAILSCMREAAAAGLDEYVWQLAWALNTFLIRAGHLEELTEGATLAVAAATRLDDQRMTAEAYSRLGTVDTWSRRDQDAEDHLNHAIAGFRRLGAAVDEARAYVLLGVLRSIQDRPTEAQELHLTALDLTSDPWVRASALNNLAMATIETGDHAAAVPICLQAIELFGSIDDLHALADSWDTLGSAQQGLGQFEVAASCYRQAFESYREVGSRYSEADSLIHYATSQQALGSVAEAQRAVEAAIALLRELKHPRAETVAREWRLPAA
jgi:DNA-binding SARP family transcriptional activator